MKLDEYRNQQAANAVPTLGDLLYALRDGSKDFAFTLQELLLQGGGGGNVELIAAGRTLADADHGRIFVVAAAGITVTLDAGIGAGRYFWIFNADSEPLMIVATDAQAQPLDGNPVSGLPGLTLIARAPASAGSVFYTVQVSVTGLSQRLDDIESRLAALEGA